MPFEIGQNVGSYRILDKLGQGGMATVYRAYQPSLDRTVAIKMLHPAFMSDPNFVSRFQREAKIVARLEHPHIVPIYNAEEQEGQPYLVMKFIEGETLKARLARAPLMLAETFTMLDAVADALTFAHQQGILHRDIKPSNILIEAGTNHPYLADFGLARMADAGESTLSQDVMLGTPHYISPEQAQGVRDLDAGTDIYSLGVILYEILVGRVPFMADTPYAIVHDHIFAALPLPSKVNPQVPQAVEAVLLRALAKDRKDRYTSAVAMAQAFRQSVVDSGLETIPNGAYRVPFPIDSRVNSGTTAFDTPRPDATPALTPAPAIPSVLTPTPIPSSILADQMKSISELRKRQQRANLWIFIGVAGLILTCLAATVVTVSAFAEPSVRAYLMGPRTPDGTTQANIDAVMNQPSATPPVSTLVGTPARSFPNRTPVVSEGVLRAFFGSGSTAAEKAEVSKALYDRANMAELPAELQFFTRAASQFPGSGEAQALAALAALRSNEPQAAERFIRQAVSLAPDSAYVILIKGVLQSAVGENAKAHDAWNAAKIAPNVPPWLVQEADRLLASK